MSEAEMEKTDDTFGGARQQQCEHAVTHMKDAWARQDISNF